MRLADYHKLRAAVQVNARPGAPQELQPLEERLRAVLAASGLEDVETGSTDDPDHLVVALCRFPAEHGASEVAELLEILWQDHLRYAFWEAHATLVDDDQVELLGASRAGVTGHYATVHVIVQKAAVPAQRTPTQ